MSAGHNPKMLRSFGQTNRIVVKKQWNRLDGTRSYDAPAVVDAFGITKRCQLPRRYVFPVKEGDERVFLGTQRKEICPAIDRPVVSSVWIAVGCDDLDVRQF